MMTFSIRLKNPELNCLTDNIQSYLRKKGIEIGHTDTLIAGIAIMSELQLITNNTNHFKRIKGLKIDNWAL